MGFEIEKKFLVKALPENLERFPYREITQGYLCRHPAVRVRRERTVSPTGDVGEHFYMTYKGLRVAGALAQEEYNLDLMRDAYEHLLAKADGTVIEKRRYLLPLNADAFSAEAATTDAALRAWLAADGGAAPQIELDVFAGAYDGLVIAEVEFPSEEIAAAYHPADWFVSEVTGDERYSNAWLAEHVDGGGVCERL